MQANELQNQMLRTAIAEIMGWELDELYKCYYTIEPDGLHYVRAWRDEWKPDQDIAAAWQVVKHLEAQGYSWQANQEPGQDCYFEFSKRLEPNEFGLVKWQSGRARETDVALAVCLAAYMAVKGEGWK
jgi:hypothetical protein